MYHSYNLGSLSQAILTVYAVAVVQFECAKNFKDLSKEEIDIITQSFLFKNYKISWFKYIIIISDNVNNFIRGKCYLVKIYLGGLIPA